MTGPVPHYIGSERVLAIDFGVRPDPGGSDLELRRGRPAQVLLGIGGDTPHKHARLGFNRDGALARDLPATGGEQRPELYDEGVVWHRHYPRYPIRAVIHCERAYAFADCRDMAKMLEHVAKLAGRSTGPEALVQVELSAAGVRLASLGTVCVSRAFDCEPAPRDELGSCVVLARALLDTAKRASGEVQLTLDPHSQTLRVGNTTPWLWTVNTIAALPCTTTGLTPTPLKISTALRRAAVFASEDVARPNMNQVLVTFADSEVVLTATDGHNLYREAVHVVDAAGCSAVGSLSGHSLGLPLAVAKRLTLGKDEWLRATVGDEHWHIERGGCTFAVPRLPPAFPPTEQLLAQHRGMVETLLASKHWAKLLAYANKHYSSKAWGQTGFLYFGPDCVSLSGRSEFRKGRGDNVEKTYTDFEGETFGPEGKEPAGGCTHLALAYMINALEALPEGDDLLIKHSCADQYDPVFFSVATRTVLVMPSRS